jgi:hypothetical protein
MKPATATGENEGAGPAVGPVLSPGPRAQAVLAAIRELNQGVEVVDRGAYLRVQVRQRCHLTRSAVERHLGATFLLPGDLEEVMVSFAGTLSMSQEEAFWT